jgi:hypothetical protein
MDLFDVDSVPEAEFLVAGTTLGNVGWTRDRDYPFTVELTAERFRLWIDGGLEIDVAASPGDPFSDGRFALYTCANPRSVWRDIVTDVADLADDSPALLPELIDLSSWLHEDLLGGTPSNWVLSADSRGVDQTVNANATFYYSDFSISGITIGVTAAPYGDDDWFGFALGYNLGDISNPNADFILVDWKQVDQGTGLGLHVFHIHGEPVDWFRLNDEDPGDVTLLALATTLGNVGYSNSQNYDFRFSLEFNRFRMWVNDQLEADIAGDFEGLEDGSFAFHISGMEGVRFRDVYREVDVPALFRPFHLFRHLVSGGDAQMIGVIDDLQIFSQPAGQDEEQRLALRELDGDEPDLVEYFKFSTGTGITAFGEEGGSGTLDGTAQWVGFEGGEAASGKRKPVVVGVRQQVSGIQVDDQRLVWQVNHGPTAEIVPLEGGHPSLLYDGDFLDVYDNEPIPGRYSTELGRGLIKLGVDPSAPLSFFVRGDAPTDKGESGFSDVAGVIMRRIVQRRVGISNGEIDLASLDLLAALRPGPVGYSTGTKPVKVRTVLDALASTLDGWWVFHADGKFSAGARCLSASRTDWDFELNDDEIDDAGPKRGKTTEVARSWTVRYREYESTPSIDQVLGAVGDDRDRFDKTQKWRETAPQHNRDPLFTLAYPEAVDRDGDTLYDLLVDARNDAWRRLQIDTYARDFFTFPSRHLMLRFPVRIGGTFLYSGSFPGAAGRVFVVAGFNEDPASGRLSIVGWAPVDHVEAAALAAAQDAAFIDPTVTIPGSAGRGED